MSSILHILNGDATKHSFDHTGLDGDVMVWREVLSEGPVMENITSAQFWNTRLAWISDAFNEQPESYHDKVVNELAKLGKPYQEINLWFDFDLHCQVNLLGVMHLLNQKTDLSGPAIYLICPADYPGMENFKGLGELNSNQFEDLYDGRERLNEFEFELASEAWQLYVNGDANELEDWLNSNTFWGTLHLLKPALQAHLKRLRFNKAGLNDVEQKLLDIYQSGVTDKLSIYPAFWKTEKIYGMGDKEIDIYLKRLREKKLIA